MKLLKLKNLQLKSTNNIMWLTNDEKPPRLLSAFTVNGCVYVFVLQSVCVTMGSVRMVWQEAAGACVIKAGKELPAL